MHNFAKMRQLKLLKKEPPVLTSFQNKLQLFRKQKFKLSTNNITSFMSSNKHHKVLLLHNEIVVIMSEIHFHNLKAKLRIIEWLQQAWNLCFSHLKREHQQYVLKCVINAKGSTSSFEILIIINECPSVSCPRFSQKLNHQFWWNFRHVQRKVLVPLACLV